MKKIILAAFTAFFFMGSFPLFSAEFHPIDDRRSDCYDWFPDTLAWWWDRNDNDFYI